MTDTFASRLTQLPLIAILRGLQPANALAVGEILLEAGFTIIEVPLNSPYPFESISQLANAYGNQAMIGAGTVLSAADVGNVHNAGGQLIVTPHLDQEILTVAKQRGIACAPGVATPSESFAALAGGADALKLFPAEMITPKVLKALRAVFPAEVAMLPVGGITPDNMADYWNAGASGFGLGSALFNAEYSLDEIKSNAEGFVTALNQLRAENST